MSEVNQLSSKFTGGRISLQGAAGLPAPTRYQSSNWQGLLLGPTVGTVEDIRQTTATAVGAGEWSKQDTRALRRIIPYQNLMLARQLFDQLEDSFNETLGVHK